jgi:hypothetical protein
LGVATHFLPTFFARAAAASRWKSWSTGERFVQGPSYRGFGKIAPELLAAKGAIDNSLRKPAERVGGLSLRPTTRPQNRGSVGPVGYFGFLVDRIRSTAAFTVIPGSSSRAIISSLVCPRLLASRMNTLSQAVFAANWCASISWNGVSWCSWSLMAEGLNRLVPVSLYFLPLISIGLRGNTLRESPGSALAGGLAFIGTRFGFSGQAPVFARRYSLTTAAQARPP